MWLLSFFLINYQLLSVILICFQLLFLQQKRKTKKKKETVLTVKHE